jgi:hypothetical protein
MVEGAKFGDVVRLSKIIFIKDQRMALRWRILASMTRPRTGMVAQLRAPASDQDSIRLGQDRRPVGR